VRRRRQALIGLGLVAIDGRLLRLAGALVRPSPKAVLAAANSDPKFYQDRDI